MFIKICGLQTADTVRAAVDAGADAVGFVFAPGSPRTVSTTVAAALVAAVPTAIETVGVFRNQPIDEVIAAARAASLTTVQLHGSEPHADFRRLADEGLRPIRAIAAAEYRAVQHDGPARLLLDAAEPGAGATFDETELRERPSGFWLLAGGLRADNVSRLIRLFRPSGVDVSSGVERARGVKDPSLIAALVAAANAG